MLTSSDQLGGVLVARAGFFLFAVDGFFDGAHVGQRQLGLDHGDVVERADLAGDVDHVRVFKAAHHVDDGVGFADVRQELVAQAFALGCAGDQAGDVDEFHCCRKDAFRLDDVCQRLQARIGHFDHADVRFDGAERIVFGGDARLGQGIEQGRFTDVGQADDAAFEAHDKILS